MTGGLDAVLIFAFLCFLHAWGGAALGAGVAGRRWLPIAWGLLVGGAPLYFGLERGLVLGQWAGLAVQLGCLVCAAAAVGWRLPGLRARLLAPGMTAVMAGSFLMAGGGLLGALLFRAGRETLSVLAGGVCFIFGAMWFGAGVQQLRGPQITRSKDQHV